MQPDNVVRLFAEPEVVGDFDALWKVWPRKDGKVVARQKYIGIIRGGFRTRSLDKSSGEYIPLELSATPEQILKGAMAYVSSQLDRNTYRLKDDGKFIPHLSTWLGRAGWQDFE